jgi:CHAT domain-containing protein
MGSARTRWSIVAFCAVLITGAAACRVRPEDPQGGSHEMNVEAEPVRLEVGQPVLRDLPGGGSHSYLVGLTSGQYVRVAADQRGIDVILRLFAPDGTLIREVDSPNGSQGPEKASEVARMTGDYRITVASEDAKAKPAAYEIRIEGLRPATEEDRILVQAEGTFHEGETLRRQKDWPNAKDRYEQALASWRSLEDHENEAMALYQIGTAYEALGEGARALETYDQASAAYRLAGDPRGEATVFNRRGRTLYAEERVGDALASFQKALEIFQSVGDLHGQATSLNGLGAAFENAGRTGEAISAYDRASTLWKQIHNLKSETSTLLNLGQVYLSQDKREEARDALEEVRKFAEQEGALDLLAISLSYLGDLDQRDGRVAEARANLERALELQKQAGDEQGQAMTLSNLGAALIKGGDLQGASKAIQESLALSRKLGDSRAVGTALTHLGRVHFARQEDQEAVARNREAFALFHRLEDRQGMALAHYGVARSLARLGDLEGARQEIEQCLALYEDLRTEAPGLEFRAAYFASRQHYWDLYIDTLMRLADRQPKGGFEKLALQAAERRRARSLLDSLTETRAKAELEADPGLAAEIQDVRGRLSLAEAKRMDLAIAADAGGDEASVREVESSIRTLLNRLDVIRTRMREHKPRLAALTRPDTLEVPEIQKLLDPDSLLLVYSLGEERSFLWTVSQRSVESHVLAGRAQIETTARQYLDLQQSAIQAREGARERVARALSDLVLKSARDRMGHFHRLVIVGDGALQSIPFAPLPDPVEEEDAAGQPRLLVEGHELVHLPSVSVFSLLRQRESRGRKPMERLRMAVIADPVFRPDDPRVQGGAAPATSSPLPDDLNRSVRDLGLDQLERLPYTREEAESILAMVKRGDTFRAYDFEAAPELLTQGKLRDYHILHIATHSLLNSRQPELSGIVFSLVDPSGVSRRERGFLRLHEIYDLDLNASLVVLSSCETGAGKDLRGEGLLGITRGFLAAGVPQLVVSLWKVEDQSTAELMKRFYHQLLERGQSPAAALRQAQLSMLREPRWSHPRNWAGFVFVGDFRRKHGGIEEQDSGGVIVVKKAGSELPPPKMAAPDRPAPSKKKPEGSRGSEPGSKPLGDSGLGRDH